MTTEVKAAIQQKAPLYEALMDFKEKRIVPFDVPGHKRGRGNPELLNFLGQQTLSVDVNSMKPLDNLCHPVSVIKEAEDVAARAFKAQAAFFMVGGTTSAVQAMVFATTKRGEEIILPRNVHRSVINALVLNGAIPVYVNPDVDERLGIALGMSLKQVEAAILAHPNAKAIFVNNPTYYGVCSDLKGIVALAHQAGMKVLADEAHGTHFYFGDHLPVSAMEAGADFAAVSMHKSGGSLTQSSFLLMGDAVNADYVRQVVNLTQTTSASYLLMASLDLSRRHLALNGQEIFSQVVTFTNYVRQELTSVGGYYVFGEDLINGDSIYAMDPTKLSIHTLEIGLAGIEVYDLLRDEYDIQIEFGDLGNILAYISVGDRERDIERLVSALVDIKRRFSKTKRNLLRQEYIEPHVVYSPQQAFYSKKCSVLLEDAIGKISTEFVMCYPPGIPIVAPGEMITEPIVQYIQYAKEKGCQLTGTEHLDVLKINVMEDENGMLV